MSPSTNLRFSVPLTIALGAALAFAPPAWTVESGYHDGPFQNDAEPNAPKSVKKGRQWQEGSYRLPPWPKKSDLIKIKVDGPNKALTHYIDKKSLSTGADGVVRYTLVVQTRSGARNVSFEGMRCTPKGRWKTYAFGIDGRFKDAGTTDQWNAVSSVGADQVHYDLWRHYLCVSRAFEPRSTRDQIRMLKNGRVPAIENTNFMTD